MTSPADSIWNDPANIDRLRALLDDPHKFTARDIVREFWEQHQITVSRSGIIAKVRRLGLTLPQAISLLTPEEKAGRERRRLERQAGHERRKARLAARAAQPKRRRLVLPHIPKWDAGNPGTRIVRAAEFRRQAKGEAMQTEQLPPVGQRRTFTELSDAHCKYIFGDPKQGQDAYFFCGDQVLPGQSWCSFHDRLCRPGAYLAPEPFLQAAE